MSDLWETLLKIQANMDDLAGDVKKLEQDEVARSWLVSLFPKHKTLSETIENTRQLLEGFSREFRKHLTRSADNEQRNSR